MTQQDAVGQRSCRSLRGILRPEAVVVAALALFAAPAMAESAGKPTALLSATFFNASIATVAGGAQDQIKSNRVELTGSVG